MSPKSVLNRIVDSFRLNILRRNFKLCHRVRDSNPSFTLFFDLPPEIRERIYELCCDNDRQILEEHFISAKPPPEPAIACASKQLRHEALPVFYRHYRFPVTFSSNSLINQGCLEPGQEWRAARWYHWIDPDKLRMIRRLELYYCFGKFEIDFDARGGACGVKMTAWGDRRLVDVRKEEERELLLGLVRSVVGRVVVGQVGAREIDALEIGEFEGVGEGRGK